MTGLPSKIGRLALLMREKPPFAIQVGAPRSLRRTETLCLLALPIRCQTITSPLSSEQCQRRMIRPTFSLNLYRACQVKAQTLGSSPSPGAAQFIVREHRTLCRTD
jgi:hypothetical protein